MHTSRENQVRIPVLLIGYNRPDFLLNRFRELATQEIGHLTISIDGEGMSPEELTRIEIQAKEILKHKKFHLVIREKNFGLCAHIVSAISEILSVHPYVIILEDDISVGENFYTNMVTGIWLSEKIGGIAAVTSFSALGKNGFGSITSGWRKTRYFSCWGWATSRDIWEKYVLDLAGIDILEELSKSKTWKSLSSHQKAVWHGRFTKVKAFPSSTWDIQFQFMCFRYDLTNLAPTRRFSSNHGFDDARSEHTSGRQPRWMRMTERYEGLIPAEQLSWIARLCQNLIDTNTTAGDSRLTAWIRHLRMRPSKKTMEIPEGFCSNKKAESVASN